MLTLTYRILLLQLALALCNCLHGQAVPYTWEWAEEAYTLNSEFAQDVAVDPINGDVIVTGEFTGDISAFYGPQFVGAQGGGFVARYNSSGALLWAFKIGDNDNDRCKGVAIDASGNIYITGYLTINCDFKGNSPSSVILSSVGGSDAFIAKYDQAGMLQWVKSGGGSSDDEGLAVAVNGNRVYISGYYHNAATFGALSTNSGINQDNILLVAYDATTGSELWLADAGCNSDGYGHDVVADVNTVYITGTYKGSFTLYDASGSLVASPPFAGNEEGFVAAFSSTGTFGWLSLVSGSGSENSNSLTLLSGDIFITGSIDNAATFTGYAANPVVPSALDDDFYVARLNGITGATQWVKCEAGSNNQTGTQIASDGMNIVVCGNLNTSMSFVGGPTISSTGNDDLFVARYRADGTFDWVQTATGVDDQHPNGIACTTTEHVFVCGAYQSASNFGPYALPGITSTNIFVARMSCPPITINSVSSAQTICEGTAPATLTGIPAGGSPPYIFLWEESADNIAWSPAVGINNLENYSPPVLFSTIYYRRTVSSTGGCLSASVSTSILISVDLRPTNSSAGADQTICSPTTTLAGNTALIGNGMWSLVTGTGTLTVPSSETSAVTAMSAGANTFRWVISNGTCPSSADTVIINVDAMPTAANAGPDQTLCSSSSAFAGNTPISGNGAWTLITGTGTPATPTLESSVVTALSVGANSFQWEISNGTCPSSLDTVIINVDAMPTAANAGSDQTLCSSSATFTGNTPLIGNGMWTLIIGTGTPTSPTSESSAVTALSVGANSFEWSISNGTCPSSLDTVTINVDAIPTVANAGVDQTLCSSSATHAGNVVLNGNGMWTLLSGNGTITTPTSETSGITAMLPGANIFEWMISNGTCPSSADTVTINVDATPTAATAGPDQTLCSSFTTLAGNTALVGTATWTLLSGTGTVTTPNSETSGITAMLPGANTFEWMISNGTCPSSSDTVLINVDAMPTVASAGIDQTLCSSSVTLAGNPAITGNGLWSLVSGTGSLTTPTIAACGITAMSPGVNIFEWLISNGTCPSSADTVIITVDAMPTVATAGGDETLCSSTTSFDGNAPITGSGMWTLIIGTGTITTPGLESSGVTGLSVGANSFVWTISNGTCPSSADTVTITVDAMPTVANAGPDQMLCSESTLLAGNTALIGTGTWSLIAGTGSVSSPNLESSGVISMSPGTNIFQWLINNGTCPSNADTVIIDVENPPTIADAGPDQIVDHPFFTLQGNVPVYGTGAWEIVSGTLTLPNPADPHCSVGDMLPGVYTFRWVISGTVCDSTTDEVSITVNEFVIPNGFSPNNDGINDYFIVPGVGYWENFTVSIFNRWGQLVYYDQDYRNEWNGQNNNGEMLIDDTYYYSVEIPAAGKYAGFVVIKRE